VHSSGATRAKERKCVDSIKKYLREKDMTFPLIMFNDEFVFPLSMKYKWDDSENSGSN
jgi:hypothetical protein